ncbi:Fumarylacetoacetate (FAA) hydrolase family protein [Polaromonas sp. OV174]|uniref:fumarylacetoacetate hydrolase family protein n=1 Tax=Polaromonas sp. OV174 TaxID=1855300 RepID=UPI0008F1BC1A|nr:fumarylacetoacetate hydrolase family protein [Polaromonas sp. OV174]SFC78826.1 Fumarylacetoacetate (FAA) hydrolase family protein [Polaromonas sp. OV174]
MNWLPEDKLTGTLVARAWIPDQAAGLPAGPSVVALRGDGVFDLSQAIPTMSGLLEAVDPAALVRATPGRYIGSVDSLFQNSLQPSSHVDSPRFLAPCDLQVIKAAGVTFAASLVERVIEEQAKGDARQAEAIRGRVLELLGGSLASIVPGSAKAQQLKELLVRQGLWSQYLEVGIGPDAEVFTKGPVLSAVGTGAEIGIHSGSAWNNPEPEVVLAVNSRGKVQGAALGNDVNLRDFEGRSALLLGKAKDNNASCAIGPFIRLFDTSFALDDVRRCTVSLDVQGPDGFVMRGESSMSQISRDPLDLVRQTLGAHHQYPDGFMLFLGTMFAPTQDRGAAGSGFTHQVGDVVTISSPKLGALVNKVNLCERITPWTFGLHAFFSNLVARGLLTGR